MTISYTCTAIHTASYTTSVFKTSNARFIENNILDYSTTANGTKQSLITITITGSSFVNTDATDYIALSIKNSIKRVFVITNTRVIIFSGRSRIPELAICKSDIIT